MAQKEKSLKDVHQTKGGNKVANSPTVAQQVLRGTPSIQISTRNNRVTGISSISSIGGYDQAITNISRVL